MIAFIKMRSVRIPYFRIWYSSLFVFLFLATLILTWVSPADLVYQSIRTKTIPNIFSIGGAYALAFVICGFVWSSRIYTNRLVLREIPKAYIPVDYGEVPKKVHKMIKRQWARSALVAWDSRPRDIRKELVDEAQQRRSGDGHIHFRKRRSKMTDSGIIPPTTALSVWGSIAHPGWSSPTSEDLPNLHYPQVVQELPNLIEAKAVSLAPPDPAFVHETSSAQPMNVIPDARVVALLQRPLNMGLRDYMARLDSFNLINPPELAPMFLGQYEQARFSTTPLSEQQFRDLMASFASILSGMTELDPLSIAAELSMVDDYESELSLTPSLRSMSSTIHHRLQEISSDSVSFADQLQRQLRPTMGRRPRSSSTGTVLTAPSRMSRPHTVQPTPSALSLRSQHSFTRTRTGLSNASSTSASLRSAQSVIRLTPESRDPTDLPYQFMFNGT